MRRPSMPTPAWMLFSKVKWPGAPKRTCRECLASQSRSGRDDQAEARLRPGLQDRRQALPGRTTVAARPHEGEAPRRWLAQGGRSQHPLRKWFGHDPDKWDTFRTRYARELGSRPEAWQPIVSAARRGTVTLIYSSHDAEHNNAVALQQYLRAKVRRRATPERTVATNRSRRSRR